MTGECWNSDFEGVSRASEAVAAGGVIGFPTDTVYGLACSAGNRGAMAKLFEIKGRPASEPLILMVASLKEFEAYVVLDGRATTLAARFWPGPLTLILPASGSVTDLGRNGSIGVRIPNHSVALALLGLTGALATTSANVHGQPPVENELAALEQLTGLAGALRDPEQHSQGRVASSILDLTREQPVLLREGRLSARELGVPVPEQNPGIRRD